MRLCTYRDDDGTRLGRVEGDRVRPLDGRACAMRWAPPARPGPGPRALADLELLAPLRPGKLSASGSTTATTRPRPAPSCPPAPALRQVRDSVTGPGAPIERPAYAAELDYEGELAVVIGRRAREVRRRTP